MAKKIFAYIKLQVPAGKQTQVPPLVPLWARRGQYHGVLQGI